MDVKLLLQKVLTLAHGLKPKSVYVPGKNSLPLVPKLWPSIENSSTAQVMQTNQIDPPAGAENAIMRWLL